MRTQSRSTSKAALNLLIDDHPKVKALLNEFDNSKIVRKRNFDDACDEFTLHNLIEEKIFYPKTRTTCRSSELMNKAILEHAGAKELISKIKNFESCDKFHDSKIKMLLLHEAKFYIKNSQSASKDYYGPHFSSDLSRSSMEDCDIEMLLS